MKKKILKIAGIAVAALVIVAIVGFYLFGNMLIRKAVVSEASKVLGVPVHLDDVKLSILKGSVELKGLVIENPAGYKNKNLLEMGDVRVGVNIGSLLSDTIKISEIKLDQTHLTIEQKGLSTNLQEILKNLPKGEKEKPEPQAKPQAPGKKLVIDDLEITGTKVTVNMIPLKGETGNVTMNLDTIKMTNLGADNKLDIGTLVSKVLVAIAEGVAKQGTGLLPDSITGPMKDVLGQTGEMGKKILESGKDAGSGVIEGFKGLLKPKK